MTHHHLGFKRSYGFQNNAYNDKDRRTAHSDAELRHGKVGKDREYSDNAQEERSHKSNLAENSLNEIACRLARTYTRYAAVILSEIIGDLDGIILH